jgi:hypothetical protein
MPSARVPFRHISLRVPWHDRAWTGTVCKDPRSNAACLILPRIRELRDDDAEERVAEECVCDIPAGQWPPCINERGTFMAPFDFTCGAAMLAASSRINSPSGERFDVASERFHSGCKARLQLRCICIFVTLGP